MSWKNQGGNKKNLKVNNLNAVGGYWNYKDSKFYHNNIKLLTTVGIGTSKPFSRLSFGDYTENLTNLPGNTTNFAHILALNETDEGKNGVGIGYYNRGTSEYGLKFIVGNNDHYIHDRNKNIKLFISNQGTFLFNKQLNNATGATIDISGSISTNSSITIGDGGIDTKQNIPIGTLKFKKNPQNTTQQLWIKITDAEMNEEENWYVIQVADKSKVEARWKAGEPSASKQPDIYYSGKVSIDNNQMVDKTENMLSVKGNIIIANNNEILTKTYIYPNQKNQGYLLVGKSIVINPPIENYDAGSPKTILTPISSNNNLNRKVLLNLNLNRNSAKTEIEKVNFMLGGYNTHFDNTSINNILFGNNSSIAACDYSFLYGNNCKADKNDFSFTFGNTNEIINQDPKENNIVFGSNHQIKNSGNCAIFGTINKTNSDNSYLFGNNNQILNKNTRNPINFIVGVGNQIKDKTSSGEGRAKGYIIGNTNNIISDKNKFTAHDCDAIIFGDSNKCELNMNIDQESTILGSLNISYHNSIILGDSNTNDMKITNSEKIAKNEHTTFIIGNNINNTYPYTHSGWIDYNRLDTTKTYNQNIISELTENETDLAAQPPPSNLQALNTRKTKLEADLKEIKNIPPLLLVVGQGNIDGTFDADAGTFSVDTSGNVRCTNIVMNKPNTGKLRCEEVHIKKLFHLTKQIPIHEYVHQFEFRLWKTGDTNIDTNFHTISLPYSGQLTKIISVLNLPNIQAKTALGSIKPFQDIEYQIKNSNGNIKTITHERNTSYMRGTYPQSIIKEEKGITGFNIPNTPIQNQSIQIKIVSYQQGWSVSTDWKQLTKVKITLVIDRSS